MADRNDRQPPALPGVGKQIRSNLLSGIQTPRRSRGLTKYHVLRSSKLLILTLSIVRTGRRNRKHSPQRAALKTAAHPARHEPPGFDFRPGRNVANVAIDRELQRVHAEEFFVAEFLRHFNILNSCRARLRLPNPWTSASRCRRCLHPSVYTSADHKARRSFPVVSYLPGT